MAFEVVMHISRVWPLSLTVVSEAVEVMCGERSELRGDGRSECGGAPEVS